MDFSMLRGLGVVPLSVPVIRLEISGEVGSLPRYLPRVLPLGSIRKMGRRYRLCYQTILSR
jgi:hypothetical protein